MASTAMGIAAPEGVQPDESKGTIRLILADTQAIFRAGLRKIFALEDDIRVVGQAESLSQTLSAIQKFSADILVFEAALTANPPDTVSDILRQSASCRLVVVLQEPDQEMTLELFRRGAHAIVSREVEPEMLVDCLRKVAQGQPWLEARAIGWVLEAYRTQGIRPAGSRPKVQLTPKEALIVSCVTQGMKNKEIAVRVGTTEQVVKNYLRKVYDKLGVADRLELALYCLNHRVAQKDGDGTHKADGDASRPSASSAISASPVPEAEPAQNSAAAAASGSHQ
ncbi:MAG TPA: response regulator transcription factor [Terriglobales bacterium]|nr:response regulator transcription factor [Terriglobales bacterium]